jgi:hypothetical protein
LKKGYFGKLKNLVKARFAPVAPTAPVAPVVDPKAAELTNLEIQYKKAHAEGRTADKAKIHQKMIQLKK